MKQSELVKETLGDHIFNNYIKAKEVEIEGYRTQISQWELDNYLRKY